MFYIIAYSVLLLMIIGFFTLAYRLLNKQPDANPEPKEGDSPNKTEPSEQTQTPVPHKEIAIEEDYKSSSPALSYLRAQRKRQRPHIIRYKSPYLGTKEALFYYPRIFTGRKFDDVKGIIIEDKFVLLREIFLEGLLPKNFEGHLPSEEQIKKIFEHKEEISKMLEKIGEERLKAKGYLYTCGNKEKDATYNYSLHFATGNEYYTDCDDTVSAFLVMEL